MTASWPLIAYTLCGAIACGVLGVQGAFALGGRGARVQAPGALIALVAAALAAVFACMRVGRLDRVFNVFGHPASPIAQTFIAIVVLVLVAVIYLLALRRSEEQGDVPAWCAVLAVLAAAFGVYAIAAGDVATAGSIPKTVLAVALVAANSALVGTLTCRAIEAARGGEAAAGLGVAGIASACVSGVATVLFSLLAPGLGRRATSITSSAFGFESAHPTQGSAAGGAIGSSALTEPLFWVVVVALGIVVPLVVSLLTRKRGGLACAALCVVGVGCALVGLGCTMHLFMFTSSATSLLA